MNEHRRSVILHFRRPYKMFDAHDYMSAFGYLSRGHVLTWLFPVGDPARDIQPSAVVLCDDVARIEEHFGLDVPRDTYDCRVDLLGRAERLEAARKHSGRKSKK